MGIICLSKCRPEMGSVEIASITYPKIYQKSEANTESVYLLINYCINQLNFRKIVWRCNNNNLASKQAALRLGFEFEGLFYNHMIVKGKNRDTAWYGITDKTWSLLDVNYKNWLSESNPKKRNSLFEANNLIRKRGFYKVNTSHFEIMPNQSTKWQNHIDYEVLIAFSGVGQLYSGESNDNARVINQYDIIPLPPFKPHMIRNVGTEPLKMGNIWWQEDDNISYEREQDTFNVKDESAITIILPSFTTPNGRMHLGHLSGPVLNADILHRTQKSLGYTQTYQLCGTLGYQTHVAHAAKAAGLNYTDTALKYSEDFIDNYKLLSVEFDTFTTLSKVDWFIELADKFILHLHQQNALIERTTLVPYCEFGHGYIFEANVRGKCPHCNNLVSAECEYCADFIPDHLLIDPICTLCNSQAIKKPLTRLFISLDAHRQIIQNLLMNGCYRENTASFVNKILSSPLPEIPLSIYAENGIPVNIDGFKDQKIYSAIELIPRFLTAFQDLREKYKFNANVKFLLNLFFGYDNSYLRCIIFPILLKLSDIDYVECNAFFGNEFYLLNGSKFSTSRSHVIYARDIVRGLHPDWLRLYLVHQKSSFLNRNFILSEMHKWVGIRRDKLLLILNRIHTFLNARFSCIVPESGIWLKEHNSFYGQIRNYSEQARQVFDIENFDSSRIVRLSDCLLEELYVFSYMLTQNSNNYDTDRTTISLNLLGLKAFAIILWPIMPNIMQQVLQMLGEELQGKPPLLKNALKWIEGKTLLNNSPAVFNFLKGAKL
ncbi:MAG: GNAT family N-acetyltransferase [Burkholderiales bacterium]|nr:GNAT family N-acetyltransferase [Burkholderiales bacterium]